MSMIVITYGIKPITNNLIIIMTLFYKIPPLLPLPKGGTIPLFDKEGRPACAKPLRRRQGGDFLIDFNLILIPLLKLQVVGE